MTENNKVVLGRNDAIERLIGGNQTNRGNRMIFPTNTDSRGTRAHHASGDAVGHYATGGGVNECHLPHHFNRGVGPAKHTGVMDFSREPHLSGNLVNGLLSLRQFHAGGMGVSRESHGYGDAAGYGDDEDSGDSYSAPAPRGRQQTSRGYTQPASRGYAPSRTSNRYDSGDDDSGYDEDSEAAPSATPKADARAQLQSQGMGRRAIRKQGYGRGAVRREARALKKANGEPSGLSNFMNKASSIASTVNNAAKTAGDMYGQAKGMYDQYAPQAEGLFNKAKGLTKGTRLEGAMNTVGNIGSKAKSAVDKADSYVQKGRGIADTARGYASQAQGLAKQGKQMLGRGSASKRATSYDDEGYGAADDDYAYQAFGDVVQANPSQNRNPNLNPQQIQPLMQQNQSSNNDPQQSERYGRTRLDYPEGRAGTRAFRQGRRNERKYRGKGIGNLMEKGMEMVGKVAPALAGAMMNHGGHVHNRDHREHFRSGGSGSAFPY